MGTKMVSKDDAHAWRELLKTPKNDAVVLSDKERLLLDLFHQEEELRLQRCLIEAQDQEPQAGDLDVSDDQLDEQLRVAEREALEARAEWLLRKKIAQHVIVTDPVLRAVHAGENASAAERRLLPLINERDVLAMVQGALSTKELSALATLSSVEMENSLTNERNKQLAQQLLKLADEVKAPRTEDITDAKTLAQIRTVEAEVREARRRWRVMKNTVAGVIVGSGVDWSESDELRDLVMDDEDELG